ncbi:hypothetical protein A4G19_12440 [Pasteurellaceae bacterium Macca]|nr:hypothetical protein [Pasteurellaceae bacterium Macca]MCK3656245.1 hypothetical protein [Pasteurellaceae bacterium Macca]MCK3656519.1 hypothetical protein [Pasteurellaceae bacterium Macca]
MAMSIQNVVNVQINTTPKSAVRKSFGIVALFTIERGQAFNDAKTRYVYVNSQQEVEQLFGATSETAKAALPFFAQSPRAKQLVIVRWNKNETTLPAQANQLAGVPINSLIDEFKRITSGQFSLPVGEKVIQVSGLNLTECADFTAVATKINAEFTKQKLGITASFDTTGSRFLFTSDTVNAHPSTVLGFVSEGNGSGQNIGSMLKLQAGQAFQTLGKAALTIQAETVGEALLSVSEVNNDWYAFTFSTQLTDEQLETAAKFAQANDKLFGANVILPAHLEWSPNNIYKKMYDAGLFRVLPMFDKNDLYPCSSALARLLSMNFAANNSTITLKFKTQPTITADEITATEHAKAKRLGINTYTYYDDVAMIAEGTVLGGRFADEIVILDWFRDAVQKEVFARLYKSPTKIPLTDAGQAILMAAVEKVCLEGVYNGAFAPGVWTGDSFGNLHTDDYLEKGFYVYAAPMSTLSDSDREQRKATPIQVAVKLAGAIHHVDVLVNFNR